MNRNSQAHSEPKNKRQFGKKDKRELCKFFCDVIEKNGAEKGAEILVNTFLKSVEDDNAEREDKRRKRESVFIVGLICVVGVIVLTCLLEAAGRKLNLNDILGKYVQYVPLFVEGALIILPAFLKIVKMPEIIRQRKDSEGYAQGILEWLKDLGRQLSRASGMHFLILLMGITLVSTLIAQCEPMKHVQAFVSGGMYAMAHCDDNNNITDSIMLADGGMDKISASYEMKQYLAGADEIMIEQLEKAEVTGEQKNMVMHLSDEDEHSIFTCWGNESGGYGTQEQLNGKVLSTVQGWCGEKRENVFDKASEQGGAPQEVSDEVGLVSESELPDDSYSDIEDRLEFWEGIAEDYPKRTLMQLIANGYRGLALRLVWHEGVQSTTIYNYGQSILFNFECLKFADNTDKTIKKRLTVIAQIYEDIAYVCPDYEKAGEARSLAVAFRYAADQY